MEKKVGLYLSLEDVAFIKKMLEERHKELIEHIDECIQETNDEIMYSETHKEDYVKNLQEANKTLMETIEIYEEINDVKMNKFNADIEDMIAKHTPIKRGRPVGSKNKEKVNAE
jgi:hypothetical protein